jgi:hypothetical protein
MKGSSNAHEPLLDLQGLLAGIRWHRRWWVSLALLGFLAGAALVVLFPAPPTAVMRILVVHEAGRAGDPDLIETDLALLDTRRIAADAIARLGSDERPESFRAGFTAESISSDIIRVEVSGRTPEDAVARAQALADAYIADHVRRAETLANAEADALFARQAEAARELAEVDERIAATGGIPDPGLAAERVALAARITELGDQAETARVGAPRAVAGTQVVDPPHVEINAVPEGIESAAAGLVLGLGGGLALAVVMTVVRDRPVLRRDIAEHLGASVIAQLPPARRGLSRLWRSRPATERRRVAATLARALREARDGVSLLELGCARTAAGIALCVAQELSLERPVVVVDDLPSRRLVKRGRNADESIKVVDGTDFQHGLPSPVPLGECRIGVATLRPGASWTDLRRLGPETVLVIKAGYASTLWLHTVARQLADAEIVVIGVVLVHPDPRDRSDGTLWDGLHTALRGRVAVDRVSTVNGAGSGGNGTPPTAESPTDAFPAVGRSTVNHVEVR